MTREDYKHQLQIELIASICGCPTTDSVINRKQLIETIINNSRYIAQEATIKEFGANNE